jgi:hypothetical protein
MIKIWFLVSLMLLMSLLVAGCGVSQEKYDELLQENTNLREELNNLKEVYPLHDFSSLNELQEWLAENDVSEREDVTVAERWISKALEIQEDAARDGYLVSMDYDEDEDGMVSVFCITIIDGNIWWWDPETDEPFQDYTFGKVK